MLFYKTLFIFKLKHNGLEHFTLSTTNTLNNEMYLHVLYNLFILFQFAIKKKITIQPLKENRNTTIIHNRCINSSCCLSLSLSSYLSFSINCSIRTLLLMCQNHKSVLHYYRTKYHIIPILPLLNIYNVNYSK